MPPSPSAEDWEDDFLEGDIPVDDGARRLQNDTEAKTSLPELAAKIFVNRTVETDGCTYKYTCEIQEYDFVYVTPDIAEPIDEQPQ